MLVTESGIVKDDMAQSCPPLLSPLENAQAPMDVSVPRKVTSARLSQLLKVPSGRAVTPLPSTAEARA